jgi:lipopolysaccharide export system permease protein
MTLSRYLISEFLKRFFVFLFILIILFLGIDLLSKIWNINVQFKFIVLYYFFRTPGIALQMIPVSALLSTLMLFSDMAKHNELVSLYCSGRSLIKVATPMIITVSVISVLSFYASDRILPPANFQAEKIWMVQMLNRGNEFYETLHQRKAWFREKNLIYNVSSYDSATRMAFGVNLYYFDDSFAPAKHIYARQASYDKGKNIWTMKDVKYTDFSSGRAITELKPEQDIALRETPDDFKKIETKSDYLPVDNLNKYIDDLKSAGLSPAKYRVELNKRYSMAFAGLVMCLIGLPFAVRQHRRGGVPLNIGIGFALVFVYWVLFSVLLSLGISGRLYAPVSAWGANMIFIAASLLLIRASKK